MNIRWGLQISSVGEKNWYFLHPQILLPPPNNPIPILTHSKAFTFSLHSAAAGRYTLLWQVHIPLEGSW